MILMPVLGAVLICVAFAGLALGSAEASLHTIFNALWQRHGHDTMLHTIIWQIRLPRVVLAAAVGASLSLGGLVFQALLRNPLAEPYILGVSGGSAIGAILGIMAGLPSFPGISLSAFGGSIITLGLIMLMAGSRREMSRDSMLLGGVMANAFCGAVIMFLISMTQSSQMHHILFWLMGDLSMFQNRQLPILLTILPCFVIIFLFARPMNLLLAGRENAAALGVQVKKVTITLLIITSFMVSTVVCQAGLVGFVGLVVPHIFRLILGPDHRLLVPASILGGASYLIVCDILARLLPSEGEMPVGIITALIGAPLFIILLWRRQR